MSAIAMRMCWSCGQRTPRFGQYCENCAADQWNPPAEATATQHSWRTNDYARPADSVSLSREAIMTAGIVIIATILLLTFWFLVAIGVMGGIFGPERVAVAGIVLVEYLSPERALTGLVVALVMTVLSWWIALDVGQPS